MDALAALRNGAFALVAATLLVAPAMAQVTVLDQAQDQAAGVAAQPPPCGTRPINIARMAWPSAEILAEIHARLLASELGCQVQVQQGDLAATASAMGSSGEPAVAPEMWVTRIADVWNAGIEAQMFRPAAPSYTESQFEGWFVPDYVGSTGLTTAAGLAAAIPTLNGGNRVRFISCPVDWACAVINRNLVAALGLTDLVEIVEPANRFEMDTLIGEAVNRTEPIIFYYWQPNAVLAQFSFLPLDLGAYDEEASKCLARLACVNPVPSAFPTETVVTALSEWVFTDVPLLAGYFQRASLPLAEMNQMLAQLSEPGATVEAIADRFVAERQDIWQAWTGSIAPE
jgi:glycine betaine/proline transport system substrate-binding protein